MMRVRLLQLAERRARLAVRANAERESLAVLVARSDGAVRVATGALNAGRRLLGELRDQPLLAAAAAVLLVVLRPRRALGWALKGWSLWRTFRSAQRWWQALSTPGGTPARR